MGQVYKRGSRWYIDTKDHQGRRIQRSAGRTKGEAQAVLKEVEAGVGLIKEGLKPTGLTFRAAAEEWYQRRRRQGLVTVTNDRGYLSNHFIPHFGDMPVKEIRVRHVREFVEALGQKKLAPRTVRHIYASLRKLFHDLLVDEIIPTTPCILTRSHLPADVDADPEWRSQAFFTPAECVLLLSSPLIPADRKVLYAILLFTGARLSEATALRWEDFEPDSPLSRLLIRRTTTGRTKTKVARKAPVHPLLLTMLKWWRDEGAAEEMGVGTTGSLPIVPSRRGGMREKNAVSRRFDADLKRLGMRERRLHDLRRTFITLCRAGGARDDALRSITHTSNREVMDLYTSLPWDTVCAAVSTLRLPVEPHALVEALKA